MVLVGTAGCSDTAACSGGAPLLRNKSQMYLQTHISIKAHSSMPGSILPVLGLLRLNQPLFSKGLIWSLKENPISCFNYPEAPLSELRARAVGRKRGTVLAAAACRLRAGRVLGKRGPQKAPVQAEGARGALTAGHSSRDQRATALSWAVLSFRHFQEPLGSPFPAERFQVKHALDQI